MTPLAQEFLNDLTVPKKRRRCWIPENVLRNLPEAKCFEVSDAEPLIDEILRLRDSADPSEFVVQQKDLLFLPAPLTWIEHRAWQATAAELVERDPSLSIVDRGKLDRILDATKRSGRQAYLLAEDDEKIEVCVASSGGSLPRPILHPLGFVSKTMPGKVAKYSHWREALPPELKYTPYNPDFALELGAVQDWLILINSPRVIGRRQHNPHAGLARKLAKAFGSTGKFPLKAWTEICLEVMPFPKEDEGEYTAAITGRKALHFCRSHLRLRYGGLEHVKAHWRGDPRLGIKQTRYRLTAPA